MLLFWAGAWLRRPHRRSSWALAGVLLAFSVAVSLIGATGHLGGEEPFTGSESAWSSFDAAVRRFIDEGRAGARALLSAAGESHGALTDMLLAEEAVEGERLAAALPAALDPEVAEAALRGEELRV